MSDHLLNIRNSNMTVLISFCDYPRWPTKPAPIRERLMNYIYLSMDYCKYLGKAKLDFPKGFQKTLGEKAPFAENAFINVIKAFQGAITRQNDSKSSHNKKIASGNGKLCVWSIDKHFMPVLLTCACLLVPAYLYLLI